MRILFIFATLIISLNNYAFSQKMDSPIIPIEDKKNQEIGVFLGLGVNHMTGSMYVDCETCEFNQGSRFGFSSGLLYQIQMNDWYRLGMAVSYDAFGIESSYIEYTVQEYDAEKLKVPFNHTAELNMDALSVFPYINFDIFDFSYLRVGPSFSFLVNKNLTHTMSLETNRIFTNDGRVIELNLLNTNSNSVIFEDNELKDFASILYFINFDLGFNLKINDRNTLSPAFQINIPMNNVSSYKKAFKIYPWRIKLEYRYYIYKKNKNI